jgi:cytochrome c peroxidase
MLSEEEQRGLQLFRGRGNCTACHVGPNFSDEKVHNTGVAWNPVASELKDAGAGHGEFKPPTLREVARSAPYMHDGSVATLEDVVDFYSNGGRANPFLDPELRPLLLDADEKRALVAFLRSLVAEQLSVALDSSTWLKPDRADRLQPENGSDQRRPFSQRTSNVLTTGRWSDGMWPAASRVSYTLDDLSTSWFASFE